MEKKKRNRDVDYFEYYRRRGEFNKWRNIQHPVRMFKNYLMVTLCRLMPDNRFRYMIYKKLGMKIGKNVNFFGVRMDIIFPELIEIGDNTMIGQDTMLVTHEFLRDHWRKGRIKIGKNVMIGTMCLILPGVEVGNGATVAAYSLVNKNVPEGTFVGGVPAKVIKK